MPDGRIATVVAVGLISPAQAATFYGCVDVTDLLKLLAHYDPAGVGCP